MRLIRVFRKIRQFAEIRIEDFRNFIIAIDRMAGFFHAPGRGTIEPSMFKQESFLIKGCHIQVRAAAGVWIAGDIHRNIPRGEKGRLAAKILLPSQLDQLAGFSKVSCIVMVAPGRIRIVQAINRIAIETGLPGDIFHRPAPVKQRLHFRWTVGAEML